MKKKSSSGNSIFEKPFFRIVLTAASTISAVLILMFSSMIIYNVTNKAYDSISYYLLWMFVCMALMAFILFLRKRTKIHFIKAITLIIIDLALGIASVLVKDNPYLFTITAGLYCVAIAVSRVFELIYNHSIRNIVINSLIITFVVVFAIGILSTPKSSEETLQAVLLIECIFIALVSFFEAMMVALAQLKFKVLFKIIVSTYSLEVLFGLLIIIATFSFAFVSIEPSINTYPDALWYCFAIVTTIGFGDFTAVTAVGRILSVILGLYGLVVVAVITSIVVNFYNETSGKRDQKELRDIQKEEEK